MEERHPGDSRNLDFIAGPPTQATIERIRDVVIVPTQDAGTFEEYRKRPPAADPPFELMRAAGSAEREAVPTLPKPSGPDRRARTRTDLS